MIKQLFLVSGLLLLSCSRSNVEYLSVVDPYYDYTPTVYLPFELLLPKGTIAYQDGPQGLDKNLQFSLWEEDKDTGKRSEKLAFLLTIFHDKGNTYDIEKFCANKSNLGGRGIFNLKKITVVGVYKIIKAEIPCNSREVYLITNGDDSYIIEPFFRSTDSAIKAIDYAVDNIRFLPENETVKKEEQKRKEREGN